MKRLWAIVLGLGVVASVTTTTAAADEQPEIVSVADRCPVSEGGYRYSTEAFEYRIRVWLTGCPWYHGDTVTVTGSLIRTDPVTGTEPHDMTVYCEPGAPPADDRPHAHGSAPALPLPPAARTGSGGIERRELGRHEEARRSPDDCVLSIVVRHPGVEHARYEGELHYPSGQGTQHEQLALDCTSLHEFWSCDPPGSPPSFSPPPGVIPPV